MPKQRVCLTFFTNQRNLLARANVSFFILTFSWRQRLSRKTKRLSARRGRRRRGAGDQKRSSPSMKNNRRDFLKTTAAAGALSFAPGGFSQADERSRELAAKIDKVWAAP